MMLSSAKETTKKDVRTFNYKYQGIVGKLTHHQS